MLWIGELHSTNSQSHSCLEDNQLRCPLHDDDDDDDDDDDNDLYADTNY